MRGVLTCLVVKMLLAAVLVAAAGAHAAEPPEANDPLLPFPGAWDRAA
jgi:hypothetical protein